MKNILKWVFLPFIALWQLPQIIVALVTGHMSYRTYNPPAFDGKKLLSDPTVIKWTLRFVKYFVKRFKTQKSVIAWDLGNEPTNMPGLTENPDTFYVWSSIISGAIKSEDNERPVISGIADSKIENGPSNFKTIGEMCDIHTTHPYHIFSTQTDPLNTMKPILDLPYKCQLSEDIAGIPTFIQEFGSIGYMNCSYKSEADFYRGCLLTSLAHGCHGTMWWCAFDQGHFDYAPYRWNNIGSDYGFFDKDLNPKPLVEVNKSFKKLLEKLPEGNFPKHSINGTILVPRDDGGANSNILRSTYILAKQANMDMQFSYSLDKIPDSPLYILPSVSHNKSITKQRLSELLEKVENGAVLYISADTGLFRQIPSITGVDIAYREQIDCVENVSFKGSILPIHTAFLFTPESEKSEVLATDQDGIPVFFKNKYGKGFVYFLTLPLEKHVSNAKGVFYKENSPRYDLIYRELAEAACVTRIADSDNPYVRLTEHKIDENSYYIFAINYNNKPEKADIKINDEFSVEVIFGENIKNSTLTLSQNEGSLFKATKIS